MKKVLYFFSINPNISFFRSRSYFITSTVSPARERGSAEREGEREVRSAKRPASTTQRRRPSFSQRGTEGNRRFFPPGFHDLT